MVNVKKSKIMPVRRTEEEIEPITTCNWEKLMGTIIH